MTLQSPQEHPHGLSDADFDALFTVDKPIVFAFHGYPWLIHRLTYRRKCHANLHVRGYIEEGTTTTPFDMVVLNRMDRFSLVNEVIDRVPLLAERAAYAKQAIRDKLHDHKATSLVMATICRIFAIGDGAARRLLAGPIPLLTTFERNDFMTPNKATRESQSSPQADKVIARYQCGPLHVGTLIAMTVTWCSITRCRWKTRATASDLKRSLGRSVTCSHSAGYLRSRHMSAPMRSECTIYRWSSS